MRKVTATLTFLFIFAAFLSAAESAKSLFQKGVKAEARQDYEAAFDFYKAAYQQRPEELKYRVPFERTRQLASASKIKRGQKLRDQGNLPEALALFQQALEADPSNDLAAQEIEKARKLVRAGSAVEDSLALARQYAPDYSRKSARNDEDLRNTSFQGFDRGFQLGLHSAGSDSLVDQRAGLVAGQRGTNRAVLIANTVHIGQK